MFEDVAGKKRSRQSEPAAVRTCFMRVEDDKQFLARHEQH